MKHSFACTIALASVAVALPQRAHPRADDSGLATAKGINRVFVSKSCSEAEQQKISESFNDAQKLADALNTWVPAGKNQDVMDMYMGTNSSSQGDPAVPGSNYREIIQKNINREAALYGPPTAADSQLYIMCNEDLYYPDKTRTKCSENPYTAWTWNYPGTERMDHYMTYCPPYFNLPTLASDVDKAKNDQNAIKILDGFASNAASTIFHETFHLDKTVGDPYIGDNPDNPEVGIYGPRATADSAAKGNAATTMLIADCYTMAGLAIYYRDTLGLTDFPRPGDKPSGAVIGTKLDSPGTVQGAADPNDANSMPSEDDWIPLL